MNSIEDQRLHGGDEISLVDLAAIIVRRRRIFYVMFVLITAVGLAYALLAKETYSYTSLLHVAEKNADEYLEEPKTTMATLESRWLPEQQASFRAENDQRLPLSVSFSNPEDTGLIRFSSETTREFKQIAEGVHQHLLNKVQERQNALIERERARLQGRIASVEGAIEALQGGSDTGTAIAEALERKIDLEGELDSLKGPEVLVVSRESVDKTGPARVLIMVIALVLAGVFGVVGTFLAEFGRSVRAALQSDV